MSPVHCRVLECRTDGVAPLVGPPRPVAVLLHRGIRGTRPSYRAPRAAARIGGTRVAPDTSNAPRGGGTLS